MELSNSPLGIKRKLEIVGFLEWNNTDKFMICKFLVQSLDAQGNLLIDKVINQNREVRYAVTNVNKVDNQFNPVHTGGQGEYDYFYNYLKTNLLLPSVTLLAQKLNERGIFD